MNQGVIFISGFVAAAALRDVYFAGLFQKHDFFLVALIAFSLAAVIFGLVTLAGPRGQGRALIGAWRECVWANLGTAAAWLSFFQALSLLEPSITITLHSGIGSVFLMGLGLLGLSGGARPGRAEALFTAGVFLSLAVLAAVVMAGLSGAPRRSGITLALASGVFIALATDFTKRMNDQGVRPETVLAVRFIAAIAACIGALWWRGGGLGDGASLGGLAAASLVLMVGPLYLLQLGIARTSALSAWIILALGPCLTFAAQYLDDRLSLSPYTLGGIALYSAGAIGAALSRRYEG